MSADAAVAIHGAVVAGPRGDRFRLVTQPARGPVRGTVLALPPFAEEMNKSRRMCARMARAMAQHGWRVVQCDLHGCGDSAGELHDASWQIWLDELRAELEQIPALGENWLWATRAGALLLAPLLDSAADRRFDVLLWQPIESGAAHLAQLLRLHTGARVLGAARADGDVTPMQRLKAGQEVEVGGYVLSARLAADLQQATLELPNTQRSRVVWCELAHAAGNAGAVSATAARWDGRLAERGVQLEIESMPGPAFWQTQEIEECDELIERGIARMSGRAPAAAPGAAPADSVAQGR
jgi:uncharacterized protein